jgi:hypothetical protein
MWFPLMLLRATGERNGTSQVGRFIELSGATAAGKTILAIQAMNPSGYAGGSVYDLKNFIFSRVGDFKNVAFINFIQTLHLNTLLRRGSRDLFLPRGTPPGPRNLRVVFFKPNSFGSAALAERDRNWKGYGKRLLKMTWKGGLKFLKTDVHAGFSEIFGSQGLRAYWHSLAFYDMSGEFYENEDVMRDVLDKVAVVIDAQEIFAPQAEGGPSEKSIQVAVQRLSRAIERKQLCYLVITQLDRVKERMGQDDWKTVVQLADDVSEIGKDRGWLVRNREMLFPARPSTERQLLEKWLGASPNENRLRLKDSLRHVEAIFFIWTDNLPTANKPTAQTKIPVSHGLAKFVCRCMDIEWDQIGSRQTEGMQ